MSLNCCHQQAYCSSPRLYISMESHGGMTLTGETRRTREKPVPVPFVHHSTSRETDPPRLKVGGKPNEPLHGRIVPCISPLPFTPHSSSSSFVFVLPFSQHDLCMMCRVVFWDILPCKIIVDRRFRGAYCLHHQG
jgi:hypothetical protein